MTLARPLLAALVLLATVPLATTPRADAQSWPDRPIKFISSQAAGGATDVIGRLIADQLAARLGQPIVYENRPGGGNVIGTRRRRAHPLTATHSSSRARPRW